MGKRELVLVAIFLAVGIVVYQLTAPPPPPGQEGVSIGGIFQKLKREMHGARETASADSRQTVPVDKAVRMVRVSFPRPNDLTITGTETEEIAVEMHVTGRGFEQAEAKAAAAAARIKVDRTADAIALTTEWPTQRGNSGYVTQGVITIKLPKRLMLRIEQHTGELNVEGVAGIEIMSSRGDTRIARVSAPVVLTHTGGRLEIDNVPSLKMTSRNSEGSIKHVAGAVTLEFTGGELELDDIAGPLDIESRNTDLVIDAAKMTKPPFRFNGTGGQLRVTNLRTESRIDGRSVDLEVTMAAAAPVTIYSTGEDIVVSAPPGGYALDAVATEGRLVLDDGNVKAPEDSEQRVTASVRGGGPALTLRATRGDIKLRRPEGK